MITLCFVRILKSIFGLSIFVFFGEKKEPKIHDFIDF